MDYIYPSYNQQSQTTGKIIGIGIIFFIGVLITLFILYLIYNYILKNNQPKPIQTIIENIKKIIKLPENDLNIDDSIDGTCIQKRKIYDSDFDRTIYPINDNEIIYF